MAPQKIGKKLKAIRLKLGLRQIDIAKKAEINVNYYACIERDEENPTVETLRKIAKVLNLESFDILSN